MIRNIRKIGNSRGIIIPKDVLEEMGCPMAVEITPTKDGIFISPIAGKAIRRKPRNRDETDGFYNIMKSKIENNIDVGKTRWIGNREMERKL
jgi:antitoxin component of MazEF toxin-antitoxin module